MKRRDIATFLDELVVQVPARIAEAGVAANACILGTKVVVEVCRACGLRARPQAVRVQVHSPEMVRRLTGGERLTEETKDEWIASGAWTVSIGHGTEEDAEGWDGHLVAIVADRYLVDATIGQAARPAKGIDVGPLVGEVTREFLRSEAGGVVEMNGSIIEYELTDDRSYLTAPSWAAYRTVVSGGGLSLVRRDAAPPEKVARMVELPAMRYT